MSIKAYKFHGDVDHLKDSYGHFNEEQRGRFQQTVKIYGEELSEKIELSKPARKWLYKQLLRKM